MAQHAPLPAAMLPPSWGFGGGGAAARGLSGLFGGGRSSHLAHLSLMDRDFGEADYEMLLQLDEGNRKERKTSKMRSNSKLIDQLPSHKASKAEAKGEHVCTICLENIRAQQVVVTLPCKHEYHRQCISKWLKSTEAATCPCCKAPALSGKASPEQEAITTATTTDAPTTDATDTATTTDTATATETGAAESAAAADPAEQWWHTPILR